MNNSDDQEIRYRLFKLLNNDPNLTQRQMAKQMGISLGKFNYCLKAQVNEGLVKAKNFESCTNKRAYFYVPAPWDIEAKAKVSELFLQRELDEYEVLQAEIKELKAEGLGQ